MIAADLIAAPAMARGDPLTTETGIGALTLGGYVREIADRYGDAEAAVIHMDGDVRRLSYAGLLAGAEEVARALLACGVGKGTRVGILATNRPEFLTGVFGAALAGCVATTISTFFTAGELREAIGLSGCSILLVERHVLKKDFAALLEEIEPAIATAAPGGLASPVFPFLRHIAFIDRDAGWGMIEGRATFLARGAAISAELVSATAASVAASDPGALFFSSGSTGRAKGILSSHRAVALQLWRWRRWYGIVEPPRTWSANGFFFSGNFAMALGGTLSSGGTLVLQRWFDAEDALALIERERATMVLAWPHQWTQLTSAAEYEGADLSSLRYVDVASPLARHPTVTTEWREPAHAYGNTETFTLISVFPSGTPPETGGRTHGLPTPGSTIRIVDPDTGDTIAVGEHGEIAVKGPTLMLGYLGIPLDETLDDQGFLRTGDGGHIDGAGRLVWQGRINDIIKTGGANVSPLEVDAVLRDCPGVKLTQTVGVPDPLLGEIVVSCIVAHQGAALDEGEVRAHARTRLASYKVPRRVLFVTEDQIETTGSAKIKSAAVRDIAARALAAG